MLNPKPYTLNPKPMSRSQVTRWPQQLLLHSVALGHPVVGDRLSMLIFSLYYLGYLFFFFGRGGGGGGGSPAYDFLMTCSLWAALSILVPFPKQPDWSVPMIPSPLTRKSRKSGGASGGWDAGCTMPTAVSTIGLDTWRTCPSPRTSEAL